MSGRSLSLIVECLCSASAAVQATKAPMSQDESDSRLERDVVSAVVHLREHGWAIIDDVIARCVPLEGQNP